MEGWIYYLICRKASISVCNCRMAYLAPPSLAEAEAERIRCNILWIEAAFGVAAGHAFQTVLYELDRTLDLQPAYMGSAEDIATLRHR